MNNYLALLVTLLIRRVRHLKQTLLVGLQMYARLQRSAYVVGYPSTLMIEKAFGLFTVLN